MQEVVIFLEDFSWTNSQTLFDNFRKPKSGGVGMKASALGMSKPDLNDSSTTTPILPTTAHLPIQR